MSTFKQKKALNVQLAAAQKKHGAKSQAAGRIQYKINQLNQTQRKDSKGRSLGSVVRTKNGIVKSATGPVRTKPTVLSQSQKALADKKATKKVTKLPLKHQPQYGAVTTKKTTTKKTAVNPKTPVKGSTRKARMEHGVRTPIPFGKAFAAARAKGEKVFTWKGKSFTTNLKSEKPTTVVVEKPVAVVKKAADKKVTSSSSAGFGKGFGKKVLTTDSAVKKLNDNKKKAVDTTPVVTKKKLSSARGNQNNSVSTTKPIDRKNKVKNTVVEKKLVGINNDPSYAARLKQGELARMKAKQKSDGEDAKAYAKKLAAKKVADKKAADKKVADKKVADKRRADFIARKKAADKKAADKKALAKKAADKKAAAKKKAADTYYANTQGKVKSRQERINAKRAAYKKANK